MNVKTQWDVTPGKTLWAIQCKDLPEGEKLRLDILVVVVIGAYATECRGHLFKGAMLAITALGRDQSDRTQLFNTSLQSAYSCQNSTRKCKCAKQCSFEYLIFVSMLDHN